MNAADPSQITHIVLWCGFSLGAVFGFVANKTHFCTMGAVSDVVNMGDWGRMRAWLLAIAVAVLIVSIGSWLGALDLKQTLYTGARLPWLANLVGGLLFGVGMTLASGCGNKTLVRAGAGNLKSLVVFFFMAYAAQLTLRGVFAPLRAALQADAVSLDLSDRQTLPWMLGNALGWDAQLATLVVGLAFALALLVWIFASPAFRADRDNLLGGAVAGLVVAAGWYVTGHLGYGENPATLETMSFGTNSHLAESLSFVAPSAYTLELWSLWTDTSTVVTWGIAIVFGVLAGSFAYALISRALRLEYFVSGEDLLRHLLGAILMGFGGVTGLGCTIGQGISGVSTLAIGSFITLAGIIIGAAALMKFEFWRMMRSV